MGGQRGRTSSLTTSRRMRRWRRARCWPFFDLRKYNGDEMVVSWRSDDIPLSWSPCRGSHEEKSSAAAKQHLPNTQQPPPTKAEAPPEPPRRPSTHSGDQPAHATSTQPPNQQHPAHPTTRPVRLTPVHTKNEISCYKSLVSQIRASQRPKARNLARC